MHRIWALIERDMRRFRRSPTLIIVSMVMPLVQLIVLGYAFGGVMKFSDRAALDAYFPHPVHQALGEWLMPMIEPLELDFDAASSTEKYSD